MDRILVADDGSAAAWRAIEVAVDLAKKTGAALFAIAVVDPGEYRQTEITAFAQSEKLERAKPSTLSSMRPQHMRIDAGQC
jgi:nucleotide-binding universal stress UspA family protein